MAYWLALGTFLLAYWGCVPPNNEIIKDIRLDLKDPVFQRIADLQDQQMVDSLYPFFRHRDPSYRYLAARAFASIRTPRATDSLAVLLQDTIDRVRAAAAYAIGQSGDEGAEALLLRAFAKYDTAGAYLAANRAILEAVGKVGSEESLRNLATISTYLPTDTALLQGQAFGIYQYALRGILLPEGTQRMVDLAVDQQYPASVRMIAANYLRRAKDIELGEESGARLGEALQQEADPRVRMALVAALGKVEGAEALQALRAGYETETDYRVRISMLSAFGSFPYDSVWQIAQKALYAEKLQEAKQAAQYFLDNGNRNDTRSYRIWAKDSLPWPVQLSLYQAANRHVPAYSVNQRDAINYELRQRFQAVGSPYEKAMVLRALAEFGWNYKYIYEQGFAAESPIVRTATLEALAAISDRQSFRTLFGAGYRTVREDLLNIYIETMQTGDPGMIAVAAGALRNERLNFADYVKDLAPLEEALRKLELPKEIETYNELSRTIAFLKGENAPAPRKPAFNHPIDWATLSGLNNNRTATITTNAGEIQLELLPEYAPGTVANFIALIKQGFYNDKAIHRVVPNFVMQGGCPRGDGYGSLDYSIRSELAHLHYDKAGYVGMASAGNHTECTQFFITHSPTPHLDGEYTIFARVTDGMEVVHNSRIGDRIEKISLNN
jgi:cyclophilin family peptidyl-prolyl cis-trans isomerase/HEAT repeat protein